MVFMSDRDKGLHTVCAALLPHMPHFFCAQRIKRNVERDTKLDLGSQVIRSAKVKRAVQVDLAWK